MKLASFRSDVARRLSREQGMAVIVVMALIALILIYVMGNLRTFNSLGHELKLLERQQTRRLEMPSPSKRVVMSNPGTNSVPVVNRSEPSSKSN